MKHGIIITAAICMCMMAGCRQNGNEAEELGPEETVAAFCKAVAGGEFQQAMSLCDTMTMKAYIERYAEAWRMLEKKDSNVVSVAGASLADADITIDDMVKNGDRRQVLYTIEAGDMIKTKTAIVKKEEGVWKVEEITDRI